MDLLQIIALAVVQGLTEFLPISSSAHLVLLSALLGWRDQGLLMDIAAHAGSLIAVMMYFKKDIGRLTMNYIHPSASAGEQGKQDRNLVLGLLVASVPIMVAGLLTAGVVEQQARSVLVIAVATILFGVLLGWAHWISRGVANEYEVGIGKALFIGGAQALALIPGTSRAGITITAGLLVGLSTIAASRFSFLLAIPAISMATGYKLLQSVGVAQDIDWGGVLIIFCLSALTAYACIHLFLKFVSLVGMLPFVVYRIILGVVLLLFFV